MHIGGGCVIGEFVRIGRSVCIGKGCDIGNGAFLENITIGDYTHVDMGVVCTGKGSGRIKVGQHCYIGIRNILDWSDDITIGDFVHIAGPSTGLWTHSSARMALQGIKLGEDTDAVRPRAPICVGSNVYIGGNCTIYPGVTIGAGSIVAPSSAVVADVEPGLMVGSGAAVVIKKLTG